jgi:TonB family protein
MLLSFKPQRYFFPALAALLSLSVGSVAGIELCQKPGGRDAGNLPSNLPHRRAAPRRTPAPVQPKLASVTLTVSPNDSSVRFGNQQIDNPARSAGIIKLTEVKPDTYVLVVQHPGYAEQQRTITLNSGDNDLGSITLEPLKGRLIVKPNIDGASIEVKSIDRNMSVGSYAGAINNVDFLPGQYELIVSKSGYQTATRSITIRPSGTVEIEPSLEPVPTPTPTPQIVVAKRSSVAIDRKDLVVRIVGTAGDRQQSSGVINVTVNRNAPSAYVEGSLNGLPSEIELVPLENIFGWEIVDRPDQSNVWALVTVRLRQKDAKKPAVFRINWELKGTTDPTSGGHDPLITNGDVTTKAEPTHRVIPKVPQVARSAGIKGLVKVSVTVNELGNVTAANAFDGPIVLRRAAEDAAREWRFKPATRNGKPVPSTEVIYFTFERY